MARMSGTYFGRLGGVRKNRYRESLSENHADFGHGALQHMRAISKTIFFKTWGAPTLTYIQGVRLGWVSSGVGLPGLAQVAVTTSIY